MIDLQTYKKNAHEHGICAEYAQRWDMCLSKRQLMDMCLSVKAVDYLCDSIAKGWGISPVYLSADFNAFINGKYVSEQKGYTSKMYCRFKGDMDADTTLVVVIDSDVDINLPKYAVCEVYCTGNCNIRFHGDGKAKVICYGFHDNIKVKNDASCNIKRIDKKEMDSYE